MVLGGVSALLGFLLWREVQTRSVLQLKNFSLERELTSATQTVTDLRALHARNSRRISELEHRIAELDPVELFDDIFGVQAEPDKDDNLN